MNPPRSSMVLELVHLGFLMTLAVVRGIMDGVGDFLFIGLVGVSVMRVLWLTQRPRCLWRPRRGAASAPEDRR